MRSIMKVIAACLFAFIAVSCTTVPEGSRGIKYTWGKVTDVVNPGLNGFIPFVDKIIKVKVTTEKADTKTEASSKDLQRVTSEVVVNYHIDGTEEVLRKLVREVGIRGIDENIIAPRIQESFKAATAQYSAEELILHREKVKASIETNLSTSLKKYGIILESFNIVDFDFSEEFNNAIEAKQTAVQQTLKAENDLKRIEVEAKQRIAQAEAEAKAIQIQAQAIREQGGAEYVALKFVEKWDGKLPATMLGDKSPITMMMK